MACARIFESQCPFPWEGGHARPPLEKNFRASTAATVECKRLDSACSMTTIALAISMLRGVMWPPILVSHR